MYPWTRLYLVLKLRNETFVAFVESVYQDWRRSLKRLQWVGLLKKVQVSIP